MGRRFVVEVGMQDKIKRVKDMYNACAKNFSQYLTDHNMDEYNNRSMKIKSEYGNRADIVDLLFWFAPQVQTIHDLWEKEKGED